MQQNNTSVNNANMDMFVKVQHRQKDFKEEYSNFEDIDIGEDKWDNSKTDKEWTLDKYLENIGQCGPYQIRLFFMAVGIAFPTVFQILIMYFVGYSPPWKCRSDANATLCNITGIITVARGKDIYSQRCYMDRSQWEYTTERMFSFVTEFDLVCSLTGYAGLATSSFYIGWGVGCFPFGIAADKIGRKHVVFVCYTTMMLAVFLNAFVVKYWQFIVLRFFTGLVFSGFGVSMYVILIEMVGPAKRALVSVLWLTFGVCSVLVLTLKVYLLHNWRTLFIVCSAPYVVLLGIWCCLPESLRWLVSKGKIVDAKRVLTKIAYQNGKHLPKGQLIMSTKFIRTVSFLEGFRRPRILLRLLSMSFAWLVSGLTFYGVSLGANDLAGNFYGDFTLSNLSEIPSSLLFLVLIARFGRKCTTCSSFFLTGLCCFLVAVFPVESKTRGYSILRVTFGVGAKVFIGMGFHGCYVWTSELFPTVVRAQSIGFSSFCARIGASSAPFVIDLLRIIHPSLPFTIIGGFCILASVTTVWLPETKGLPTLETFEDAEKFLKKSPGHQYIRDMHPMSPLANGALEEADQDGDEVVEWSIDDSKEALLTSQV